MTNEWSEVYIDCNPEQVDALENWLFEAGALSVTMQDQNTDSDLGHAVLEPAPGEVRLWTELTATGLFARELPEQELRDALHIAASVLQIPLPAYRLSRLQDEAWERSWMRDFVPMQFGAKFWICPSSGAVLDSEAVNLMLDPGLAFGSGTHPTTSQCLSWLAASTDKTLSPFADMQVVDYGCGSGVLAIAAGMLGAASVWAVDIDEQALLATRQNAAINHVADRIHTGQPHELNGVEADLVLANILFQPLMSLTEQLASLVRPGGSLVLSGILLEQVAELRLRYNPWFEFAADSASEGWALMTAIRRQVD